nr:hypothetical protein [Allomuricauda nanhaiensis]
MGIWVLFREAVPTGVQSPFRPSFLEANAPKKRQRKVLAHPAQDRRRPPFPFGTHKVPQNVCSPSVGYRARELPCEAPGGLSQREGHRNPIVQQLPSIRQKKIHCVPGGSNAGAGHGPSAGHKIEPPSPDRPDRSPWHPIVGQRERPFD